MRSVARLIALAAVGAACLACVTVQTGRAAALDGAGTVEIVLDYRATLRLCDDVGLDVHSFLDDAVSAGATSLGLPGRTPEVLALEGRAAVVDGGRLAGTMRAGGDGTAFAPRPDRSYVLCDSEPLAREIAGAAAALGYPDARVHSTPGGWAVEVATSAEDLAALPLGFPGDAAAPAVSCGLKPVAVWDPQPRGGAAAVAAAVDGMRGLGIDLALFGETGAGPRPVAAAAGRALADAGVTVAVLENIEQPGIGDVAAAAGPALRGHLIHTSEPHSEFTLAARDRGVRVFWVRPFLPSPRDTPESARAGNIALIADLRQRLSAAGFRLGEARGMAPFSVPAAAAVALGAGVAGGAVLLAGELARVAGRRRVAAGAVGVAAVAAAAAAAGAAAALPGVAGDVGRQGLALLAALVFPALGVMTGARLSAGPRPLWRAAANLALAAGWSLAGAAIIVSLLGDTAYALKVSEFRGVKLAAAVPPLIVCLAWALAEARRSAGGEAGGLAGLAGLCRRLGATPATVWVFAGMAALAGVVAFYLARTGHDSAAPVTAVERAVRLFLTNELVARPRLKEFAIGHPALLLGLFLYCRGGSRAAWPLLALGAVGQASLVNSFCHLHAPLVQSLARTALGLLIGAALGFVAIGAWWSGSRLGGKESRARCSAI